MKKESLITIEELADRNVENFGSQRAFNTRKRYLLAVVQNYFGGQRLSQISYLDLETYRNKRKATPVKAGETRTDASVNREIARVSHMLNKAGEWGFLGIPPLKKGKRLMFKENNQRLRFLTDAEVEALLQACDNRKANSPHLRPIVEAALLSGSQREEVLSLKWEQIRNGFIYLRGPKQTRPGKSLSMTCWSKCSRKCAGKIS